MDIQTFDFSAIGGSAFGGKTLNFRLTMATPITHLILANNVFKKFFASKDKKKFFVGTSFPDIRYLGVIEREKTHFSGIRISDLQKEDSFFCGMKFHSLVDEARTAFWEKENIYLKYPEIKATSILKLLEDQLLYSKIQDWKNISSFFDEILSEELSFGIPEEGVKKWHFALQKYLSFSPTDESRKVFANEINYHPKYVDYANEIIEKLKADDFIVKAINEFCDNFENYLNNHYL